MLRVLLTILAFSTAVAAFLAADYHRQLKESDAKIAALKTERDAARRAEKFALAQTAPLKENVERLTAERDSLKAVAKLSEPPALPPVPEVPPVPAPKTQPGTGGKEMLGGIAKMFQSEEGKKMLQAQTAMVVKMQYGELAKRLKLTPGETDQLMALLGDRQNAMTGDAFSIFSDGGDITANEAKMKELAARTETAQKEYDAKLKSILGDGHFKQLQGYEKTIGDRMMMTQLEPQFAAAGVSLEPAQKEQLIQIMSDERLKTPPGIFDPANKNPIAAMQAMKDAAAVERWMQQEQDFHRRVLLSATKVLNPDQIEALREAFDQAAQLQKVSAQVQANSRTAQLVATGR